jgi:putative membrane protein
MLYQWVKVIHVLAVISWMAGLLYLPRLFVYHATVDAGSVTSETFKVMERRLLKAIMTPAMIVAWLAGLWMAFSSQALGEAWFHAKVLAVLLLSASHGLMARYVKQFARDANPHSSKYFRFFNEIPTLLMIAAVILVIVKPF